MSDDDTTVDETEAFAGTINDIHDHLEATAELPVDPTASTSLGEAAAVAADARAAVQDEHHEAAITRIKQVRELLSHVDDTGNDAADEHVHEAARLANELLANESE